MPPARPKFPPSRRASIKIKINPEKIRDVIGKGGSVIRALTEETGTSIDIEDDGTITIASVNADASQVARSASKTSPPKSKSAACTKVRCCKLLDFGAIVNVLPGKDGLLHISQIATSASPGYRSPEGRPGVKVKVLELDDKGRMRLIMKAILVAQPAPAPAAEPATPAA